MFCQIGPWSQKTENLNPYRLIVTGFRIAQSYMNGPVQ
jgi:hypothetical protein